MPDIVKSTTRQLRQNQTPSEAKIWEIVRNRQLNGYKFFRQHAIRFNYDGRKRFFIADFYSAELKLVLEIDGKIHERQKDYDEMRTYIINQLGIQVIRITNEEAKNTDILMEWLKNKVTVNTKT